MSLQVSRILHAGYVFSTKTTRLVFDPIFENPFSVNCYAYPKTTFDHDIIKRLKFDGIFISHFHEDHCSLESLNFLDRETPLYLFCRHQKLFHLIRALGFHQVHAVEHGQSIHIGDCTVTAWPALDEDIDCLLQISGAGVNVLNVVDAWITPEIAGQLAQQGPWDMVLWPFQTLRETAVLTPFKENAPPPEIPHEWLEQIQALRPRVLVPSSCQFRHEPWSWYNYALFPISYHAFASEVNRLNPNIEVLRLEPGQAIKISPKYIQFIEPLTWVHTDPGAVDYEYRPRAQPPPTSEIARALLPVSTEIKELVQEFCTDGLALKLKRLDPPEDSYWLKTRYWCLRVFDHQGMPTEYHYELDGQELRATKKATPDWVTEVPLVKLAGALLDGESLTSMYVRILDSNFEDPIEDPLIRALFNGEIASYQEAQLKRLKASHMDLSLTESGSRDPGRSSGIPLSLKL